LEAPSQEYEHDFGVKKGYVEFKGVLTGNALVGKSYTYLSQGVHDACHDLPESVVVDTELTVAADLRTLDGWTKGFVPDKSCQMFEHKTEYRFRRALGRAQ
jgi:hypothetical protein